MRASAVHLHVALRRHHFFDAAFALRAADAFDDTYDSCRRVLSADSHRHIAAHMRLMMRLMMMLYMPMPFTLMMLSLPRHFAAYSHYCLRDDFTPA